MSSLFRPWTEEVKIDKGEMQRFATENSLVQTKDEFWLADQNPEKKCLEEGLNDREIRYKNVKEHIKKRSEKSLLKRCKDNDQIKSETVSVRLEPRQQWAPAKPEILCQEMGCARFQVPSLDSGFGIQFVDVFAGENQGFMPAYGTFHSGPELLDAAIAQGLPSNLFEEYAKFLTEQQKQVAERTRKQRPKKFRCPHCQVGFSNNGQLKGHIRIHTGERPFKCDAEACGKSFTRNEELTRHRRIHSGLRPFPCPECGKRFGRKDHLKKHTKTHFQQRYQLVPILSSHCPYFGYGL